MRAAVIAGPRDVRVQDVPMPEPRAGEVRVRVEGCAVCGSDLALWEGKEWFEYPRPAGTPGHEGWGSVDAVGEGVAAWRVGDRVTGLFERAYAEYDIARADQLVALPRHLSLPGEPLACAVNAFRRSDIQRGHSVAVVGTGFLGALLVQLAVDAGARVIGISRRGTSLKLAEQMGAQHVVEYDEDWKVEEAVKRIVGEDLCDRVIEVTGKQAPLDLAAKLTRVRGRLVIAGYHQDGPRTVDMWLWNWRGLDVVNAHERDPSLYVDGMREALDLVAQGRLDPSPLFTHEFPLDRLGDALRAMEERPDGFLKAVIRP